MIRQLGLGIVLATLATAASAVETCKTDYFLGLIPYQVCTSTPTPPTTQPVKAPEIDPASAMAGLSLMAGGLVVLRGRRSKNTKA